ncbi:MAG: dihydrodipicolinate synthase family protein, partial [Rhodospirillales bacterium]
LQLAGDRILYFTGQLSLYGFAAVEHGVVGTVTGATNIWGGESVEFYNACVDGDKEKALRLQKKAVDLWDLAMANHRNLYPAIKAGMNLQGLPGGYPRPPLRPLDEPDITELRDGMNILGFELLPLAAE